MQAIEVGLARPSADPDRIRPLLRDEAGRCRSGLRHRPACASSCRCDRAGPCAAARGPWPRARRTQARLTTDHGDRRSDGTDRRAARAGGDHPPASRRQPYPGEDRPWSWPRPSSRARLGWSPGPPRPAPALAARTGDRADGARPCPLAFRWRGRDHAPSPPRGRSGSRPNGGWTSPTGGQGGATTGGDHRPAASGCGSTYAHGAAMSSGWFCQGQFA